MTTAPGSTLFAHFATLPDPRVDRTKEHLLRDILTIAVCAVICGADSVVEMEEFGTAKQEWLATFLALPSGIPSHDTFTRVFAALDPAAFSRCFLSWVQATVIHTEGAVSQWTANLRAARMIGGRAEPPSIWSVHGRVRMGSCSDSGRPTRKATKSPRFPPCLICCS